MNLDWSIVSTIIAPIIALFLGAALNHFFEHRPRLISYLSHTSAIQLINQETGKPYQVNTHAIVLRNAGRKATKNVRIGHNILPGFSIFPPVDYKVVDLPAGGKEILIPTLVPGEQIVISYLYFPPLFFKQVNTHTKSDDGFAKIVNVLLLPRVSKKSQILIFILLIFGIMFIVYLSIIFCKWLVRLF